MYEKLTGNQRKSPAKGVSSALIWVGVCLVSATSTLGQSANATLTGKITDSSGW